ARVAGTFLFRSSGVSKANLTPGTYVASQESNEHVEQLVGVLFGMLGHFGVNLDEAKLGRPPEPGNEPNQGFLETQRLLEPKYTAIRDRYGFSAHEVAIAAAVATAMIVQYCSRQVDPHVGYGIAVQGFIEGAKTAPDPVVL
ncbi:MAG: hypothetical protein J0I36_08960, partial [Pandoraea sp.]|nr:hypothetical protein [Pandoraea sp.]